MYVPCEHKMVDTRPVVWPYVTYFDIFIGARSLTETVLYISNCYVHSTSTKLLCSVSLTTTFQHGIYNLS